METILSPLILLLRTLLMTYHDILGGFGIPLLLLSATTSLCMIPFERRGTRLAQKEKDIQRILAPQIRRIKQESTGRIRHNRMTALYSRYAYHPIFALQSACGFLIQLPLLLSAYYMIANLKAIEGVPLPPFIADLSQPDGILHGMNLLPFIMTIVNVTALITMSGFDRKDTLKGLVVAGLFLLLLYNSPSALLLYWTANNLFSLIKNLLNRMLSTQPRPGSRSLILTGGIAVFVCFALLFHNMRSAESTNYAGKTPGKNTAGTASDSPLLYKKLSCNQLYSFHRLSRELPFAHPVVSNLLVNSETGLVPRKNEWGEFLVDMAPVPLKGTLTLQLSISYPRNGTNDLAISIRDTVSGTSQTFTNRPETFVLGGVKLDENNRLRIQCLFEGPVGHTYVTAMRLSTSHSPKQLEQLFKTMQTAHADYKWQQAVQLVSPDVENWSVNDTGMSIQSIGPDPNVLFKKISIPEDKAAVFHICVISPEPTMFQLFYQTMSSGGFSEENSFCCDLQKGRNALYLELPRDFTGDFRVDPGELTGPQKYQIETIEFRIPSEKQHDKP